MEMSSQMSRAPSSLISVAWAASSASHASFALMVSRARVAGPDLRVGVLVGARAGHVVAPVGVRARLAWRGVPVLGLTRTLVSRGVGHAFGTALLELLAE